MGQTHSLKKSDLSPRYTKEVCFRATTECCSSRQEEGGKGAIKSLIFVKDYEDNLKKVGTTSILVAVSGTRLGKLGINK